jgi:2,4-dienoyl-CoA reductase-like NADH-dependent reductase (Old Yellow Enzyme family)
MARLTAFPMINLSAPLTFARGPAMPNRLMLAPLTNCQSHEDGTLSDDEFNWLKKRAEGGFGLTMTCAAYVAQSGKAFPGQLGVSSDDQLPGLTRLASALHAAGSSSSVQLHHGGYRADATLNGGEIISPNADPKFGSREMSTAEVEAMVQAFIDGAVRAERAGFHGAEIHGAHTYLLCEFLNAETNQRSDRYGGSYDNRVRVFHEVIDGIRAATGPDFQLGLRLSAERFGVTLSESLRLAQEVMTSGQLDYLDMSLWDCFKAPEEADYAAKPLIDWFAALDRGTCRLGVAGAILSAETAQKCLDHGADFVLIGKGAIIHHDFARRALADASYHAPPFPHSRDHYRSEAVSDTFVDYIARTWPQYVAEEAVEA